MSKLVNCVCSCVCVRTSLILGKYAPNRLFNSSIRNATKCDGLTKMDGSSSASDKLSVDTHDDGGCPVMGVATKVEFTSENLVVIQNVLEYIRRDDVARGTFGCFLSRDGFCEDDMYFIDPLKPRGRKIVDAFKRDKGTDFDPFAYTHRLLRRAKDKGGQTFESECVCELYVFQPLLSIFDQGFRSGCARRCSPTHQIGEFLREVRRCTRVLTSLGVCKNPNTEAGIEVISGEYGGDESED